jgi:adenylate cyclase class 2
MVKLILIMAQEIEVKFLNVNHDDIRAKLKQLGAKLKSLKALHRRSVYDFIDLRLESVGGWIRLRDESDKITLTYKQRNKDDSGKVIEVLEEEVEVSNFESADKFLKAIGLIEKSSQENYREVWELNLNQSKIEIMLDEWPYAKPFIELELSDGQEEDLKNLAHSLNLSWDSAINDGIIPVYLAEYETTEKDILDYRGDIKFNQEDVPSIFKNPKK